MSVKRNRALLLNWIFVSCLLVLAINDHYFKTMHPGLISGKLSDFAGLLIFPWFLLFLVPRLRVFAFHLTAILFIFWKSSLSEGLISGLNTFLSIQVQRTVDYSDLIALVMLPVSHWIRHNLGRFRIPAAVKSAWAFRILFPFSCAVFIADTLPPRHYIPGTDDIFIGKTYRLKITEDEALRKLDAEGFHFVPDTIHHTGVFPDDKFYIARDITVPESGDTLELIRIGFQPEQKNRTRLIINTVNIKNWEPKNNWRTLKYYTKMYQKFIKDNIVEEVK